jgi:predicted negative regulator of RcsB-dependent stress response
VHVGLTRGLADVHAQIGDAHLAQRERTLARAAYKRAQKILDEAGDAEWATLPRTIIAKKLKRLR